MRRKAAITAGAIAAAGTLAWGVPTLAHAEDTPTDPPSGSAAPEGAQDRREEMRAELADRLAEELGIDADKVAAALKKVGEETRAEHQAERLARLKERLADAVENGRLTQERADELMGAAKDGDLSGRTGRHHGGFRSFGPGSDATPGSGADDGTSSGTTAFKL